MEIVRRIQRYLNMTLAALVSLMMGVMLVVIFMAATSRYLLNASPTWAEELARYLMVWVCFLGAPLAVGGGGHVGVQIFMQRLPWAARRLVRISTIIAIEVFLVIVITKAYDLNLLILTQQSPALRIPMHYVYAAAPIGCALLGLEFIFALVRGPVDGEYPPFTTGGV